MASLGKSWTSTSSGSPCGCHSRPAFLKFPTSSFFLVLTEMNGTPRLMQFVAVALMYSNCAFRIRMLFAFDRLLRCLEAEVALAKQLGDGLVPNADPMLRKHLGGERVGALARPEQRRFRITARARRDELLQRRNEVGMRNLVRRPAGTFVPDPHTSLLLHSRTDLVAAQRHRTDGKPRGTRHHGQPAVPDRCGFGASPQAHHAFIHGRLELAKLLAYDLLDVHSEGRSHLPPSCRSPGSPPADHSID